MSKPIIYIDFHGVIANLVEAQLKIQGSDLRYDDLTTWNSPVMDGIWETLQDPAIYEHMQPYWGAAEGMNALHEDNDYEVVVLTNSPFKAREYNLNWLNHHLVPFDRYIEQKDKWNLPGSLLIEDKGDTIHKWVGTQRRHAILVDQPWNHDWTYPEWMAPYIHRCYDWDEIVQTVRNLANVKGEIKWNM